jgi:Cu/Ag efflux pump CusA
MLTKLIHLSLNNRMLIVLLSLTLMAAGLYVTTTMPVDVFPDFTRRRDHLTEAHGMAPRSRNTCSFPLRRR